VADCEEFLAMGLDERVDICKKKHMCFKCLDNTTHNFAYCKLRLECKDCLSMGHHTLLHGMRRFHPLPNRLILTPKSNPL
jgi:late competence protein required for DNA uptake (superfamily II DNA/RNA helicase)